jgi:hypothetical protein
MSLLLECHKSCDGPDVLLPATDSCEVVLAIQPSALLFCLFCDADTTHGVVRCTSQAACSAPCTCVC